MISLGLVAGLISSCGDSKEKVKEPTSLNALIDKYPDSIPLLIKRGQRSVDSLDFTMALSDATKAYRLDSNRMETQKLLAKVLNNKADRNLKDVRKAQQLYHQVLKKTPKDPEVLVELAATYSYEKDFDRSFEYLDDALRIDPKFRNAYFKKGTNFMEIGRIDLAKSSYETAIQQDPNFWEAYIILGSLYQSEDNPIAIEYFRTAQSLQPKDPDVLYALAYALQTFNQTDEAQIVYREMYDADTTNAMPDFQIGYMKQFYEEQTDSAIYYYRQSLLLDPKFVQAWHNLGLCYETKKDKVAALDCYSKALKYNPDFELSREAADRLR